MKIRRLPDTDLARYAAIENIDDLKKALRRHKIGGGTWSYEPFRNALADILSAKSPLITPIPLTWDVLDQRLKRDSRRGAEQYVANAEVARALWNFSRAQRWTATRLDMFRLPVGFGEFARFWHDIVITCEGQNFIPFFDARRTHRVENQFARQVVYSMQDLWVRERNPDLMDAGLAIVSFPSSGENRSISVKLHDRLPLLEYYDLSSRVENVYRVWSEVLNEREQDNRRTGTGGANPFGF